MDTCAIRLREGEIVAITYDCITISDENQYLEFIHDAFINHLITGVHVQRSNPLESHHKVMLFVTVAAPGIDRLAYAVERTGGKFIDTRVV